MGRSGSEGSEYIEAETGNLETTGEFTMKAVGVDVNHIQKMCQESAVFFTVQCLSQITVSWLSWIISTRTIGEQTASKDFRPVAHLSKGKIPAPPNYKCDVVHHFSSKLCQHEFVVPNSERDFKTVKKYFV